MSAATERDRPSWSEVVRRIDGVEGWLTEDQARALFEAARRVPAGGRIVEIGSFRGRSTIVLASGAAPTVEVVAIDPHAGSDRGPQEIEGFAAEAEEDHVVFRRNLAAAGVADRVRHVRAFSGDALGEVVDPLDLLYVDGAHRFGPARADLRDWGTRVRVGGEMLVHDAFSSVGVTAAIGVQVLPDAEWCYRGRSRSLARYERGGGTRRARSVLGQLGALPWFVRNVAVKVLLVARLGPATRLLGHDGEHWPY